ncbi:MAG: 16S rRNA (cytosine(967)-C(5))-methyltransferase RsmB [Methylotetracoccus sp.]|nr:16S rRNA (cytosine(967)-C(5))-methyltransferase RsmB [Methylotetracoccus sp.]
MNTRAVAADVLARVITGGESLSAVLAEVAPELATAQDRGFLQALTYGVCRWYGDLDFLLGKLAPRPIKDPWIKALALVGLHQLKRMRVKPHAAVAETVSAAQRAPWAKPFLNGLLRSYQRQKSCLDAEADGIESARYAHPTWLIDRLRSDWPEDYETILTANNESPPMTLRVNRRRSTRPAYLTLLQQNGMPSRQGAVSPEAVILDQPRPVQELPGFAEGIVSVQDEAPQLAAGLLQLEAGQRVLDVCAAPGGKTAHLLEIGPALRELVALDISAERSASIQANLERAGLKATLVVADATRPVDWWDGRPFDRILLDAPCSATGVIRRHPDIKLLRRSSDIAPLGQCQRDLLEAVWRTLKPGGLLLYATCSVIKAENDENIEGFLQSRRDARELPIEAAWGRPARRGRQILPGDDAMDGFFYARLTKVG